VSYPTPDGPLEEGTVQVREVVVSYRGTRRNLPSRVSGPDEVVRFLRKLVNGDAREHFVVIHLDGRHRPIGYQVASIGTATASLVHPREIFQPAVSVGACAVLIAHNHPSGDSSPSTEYRDVTQRLIEAGNLLGIPLLDHVVVSNDGYYAMRQQHRDWFENP
jgi:DNA repair protein RadC